MRISTRDDLSGAVRAGSWRAAPGADRVPAHRSGAARAPRADPGQGQEVSSPTHGADQRNGPPEVEDRAIPGHWEGDLIIGLDKSAIGTLVERTTRYTMLLHLPRMDGFGDDPKCQERAAVGRAWRRSGPRRDRCEDQPHCPSSYAHSLTWDQGSELAQHTQLRIDTGLAGVLLRPALRPGSAAPTRTPTASCASTSPRAPSTPSRRRSTHSWTSDGVGSRPARHRRRGPARHGRGGDPFTAGNLFDACPGQPSFDPTL